MLTDCTGKRIFVGDLIKHGNGTGKVEFDEFEGYYCKLSTGRTIRLSAYIGKVTILQEGEMHGYNKKSSKKRNKARVWKQKAKQGLQVIKTKH